MKIFVILCLVAIVSIVASFLGLSWFSHPRDKRAMSKPFNRTIHRSVP